MAVKVVVCRCEDVTLHDLEHSVERGYRDIEEVKRYTGFGTGPCQGKECLAPMATQLARLRAIHRQRLFAEDDLAGHGYPSDAATLAPTRAPSAAARCGPR